MTNAEKFQEIFKKFATEVWAFPEKDFLTWLNAEYKEPTTKNYTVPLEVYGQVVWERNIAIEQLHELGYGFGEKIESTTKNDLGVDLISRADARKAIIEYQYSDGFCEEHNIDHSINTSMALLALSDLPSVTPQEPIPDKIRAEIDTYLENEGFGSEYRNDVKKIIDKYKAESED